MLPVAAARPVQPRVRHHVTPKDARAGELHLLALPQARRPLVVLTVGRFEEEDLLGAHAVLAGGVGRVGEQGGRDGHGAAADLVVEVGDVLCWWGQLWGKLKTAKKKRGVVG